MTSAQLEIHPLDESSSETEAAPFALREQVAERLAAHRSRRTRPSGPSVTPIATATPAKTRAARIAAAVTERYAHSQSYRDFLAAEAERAIHEAQAAAEVAALNAQAVAEAQNQLLFELDQFTAEDSTPNPEPALESPFQANPPAATATVPYDGLSIRFSEEIDRNPAPLAKTSLGHAHELLNDDEAANLDEEIAFRQSPTFEEPASEISANLIEFPRQLIAARKARPRLAEGPLREDADLTPDAAQLRIFEVEAAQISSAPAVESVAPEWSSILLSALPATAPVATPEAPLALAHVPQTAPFSLRLMAGIVDGCIVAAALLAFIAAAGITVQKFAGPTTAPMTPQLAIISAVGTFLILALAYQLLFFTFSESTPGMRYARIALCTLDDDNPTRSDMRRRIFASILAACPLGIGYLWACLDEDSLGWHDRISRMYQRSY